MRAFIPKKLLDLYHLIWPFLGAVVYRFPSGKLKVIGITGTNGKTTVTHLATEILEGAGYKVASISSLRFKIGEKEWKNELKMTMPGRMKIQKFLREAADAGCEYAVMEVTSEGIKQHRHNFINFDTAVFTNLTPEHLESHGGFENYKKAKGELFKIAKSAVINRDDPAADYFAGLCAGKKYFYSVKSGDFNLNMPVSLPGEFNRANALAAAYAALSQGVSQNIIKKTIEEFRGVPGRMEIISKNPLVIVDYAHTPDALEKVYSTFSSIRTGKMICVLGAAGGGRDKWKRPKLGQIAAHYCDEIILTNEDPYNEDPESIISQIEAGARSEDPCTTCSVEGRDRAAHGEKRKILRVPDRREAIKRAIKTARPDDIVIITGKGAEPRMMAEGGGVPWDDREAAKNALSGVFD